jgi:hypothetical protein
VAGIRALLGTLDGRLPLYAFTNSNPTHQAFWAPRYAELLKSFHKVLRVLGDRAAKARGCRVCRDLP